MLVVPYVFFDEVARPLFGPLVRTLARLPFLPSAERLIGSLHPYIILGVLLVPFLIAEPLKLFGLYCIGSGQITIGLATIAAAYAASFAIVDRIYEAGRKRLFEIPWFARLMEWVTSLRNAVLTWVRESAVWRSVRDAGRWARDTIHRTASRLRR